MISLPRQARDKHRENSKKRRFLTAPSFLPLAPYKGEQTYTHMINAGGGRAYILGR